MDSFRLPKEAKVFGVKVKWQKCVKCGQQVFTASKKTEALCGYCDRGDDEETQKNFKKAKISDSMLENCQTLCRSCNSSKGADETY